MGTTLWEKHQYARCFGHWLVSDAECSRCAVSDSCEKRTKTRTAESDIPEKTQETEGDTEVEAAKEVAPLDYLLQSLGGKFDHEIEERDKAVLHKFRKEGKTVIAVAIGVGGRIKILSVVKNTQKVFGSLSSVAEVEEVLAEML